MFRLLDPVAYETVFLEEDSWETSMHQKVESVVQASKCEELKSFLKSNGKYFKNC